MARGEVKYRITADASDFEKSVGKARSEFESFGKVMLAGAGFGAGFSIGEKAAEAFTGAIKGLASATSEAIKGLVSHADAMDDIRAKTGLSFKAQQEMAVGLKLTGTTAETVAGLINKMQVQLVKGGEGFEQLGLNVKKLKAEAPEKAFAEAAEKIRLLGTHTERTAAAVALFGKSGAEALKFIEFGAARSAEEARHLGAVMSDETMKAAAELSDEADRQSLAWDALTNNLASVITDNVTLREGFHQITEKLASLSRFVLEHKDEMGAWLGGIARSAKGAASELKTLADIVELRMGGAPSKLGKFVGGAIGLMVPGLKQVGEELAENIAREKLKASIGAIGGFDLSGVDFSTLRGRPAAGKLPPGFGGGGGSKAKTEAQRRAEAIAREFREAQQRNLFGLAIAAMEGRVGARDIPTNLGVPGNLGLRAMEAGDRGQFGIHAIDLAKQQEAIELAERHRAAVLNLGDAIAGLGSQFGGAFGMMLGLGAAGVAIFERLQVKADTSTKRVAAAANAIQVAGGILAGPGGAKGFLGGAASGAAAGAAFGGVGAVVGGIAGGILGLFGGGGKKRREEERKAAEERKKEQEAEQKRLAEEAKARRTEGIDQAASGIARFVTGINALDGEFGRMGANSASIFMVAFNNLMAEKGMVGAVKAMGDSFDILREKLTGIGDEAALAILGPFGELHDLLNNKVLGGAVEGLEGLREVMAGLGKAAILDAASFQKMQQTASDLFNRLVEGGASTHAAFLAIAPTIQEAINAAQRFGLPLDADMVKLKKLAEENGIAFRTDPMDRMVTVLEAIAKVLGADIPEAAGRAAAAIGAIPGHVRVPVGGFEAGEPMPGSPAPITAARGFGPAVVPDVGRGFGPLIQTHANEGVTIIPAHLMRSGKVRMMPRVFHARMGVGDDGGGGGAATGGSPGEIATESSEGGSGGGSVAVASFASEIGGLREDIQAGFEALASQPAGQIVSAPQVTLSLDATTIARDRNEFIESVVDAAATGVRKGQSPLIQAFEQQGFQRRGSR